MKPIKKILILFVATLLMATSARASGEVTIIKKLNGTVNNSVGEVTSQINEANGQCTVTVTPEDGYYIQTVTAEKTVEGGVANSRLLAPTMDNFISVAAEDALADPSGKTTWTFIMPGEDYNVEVVANFQQRTDITNATVTLATTSFNYDGEAKTPAVSSVVLNNNTIDSDNYDVVYGDNTHNNTDAGTVTVSVTGKGIYTGTATATFTINKIDISPAPTVALEGWTYGNTPETITPVVEGNLGGGNVTYTYKAEGATEFTPTVPQNAGTHTIKATIAETANYNSAEVTSTFTIAKADINPTLTIEGWTYGDAANDPTVTGNTDNGNVTYTYATQADVPTYAATVPTAAGSYLVKAVIAETTNYNGAEKTASFTIAKANFDNVVIADIDDQTFTGEALTPAITVTFNGNAVDASEYTANYASNTNVGTATVTLTSKNVNFVGGQTNPSKTFQIAAAQAVITANDQTVTYNGQERAFTNYEVTNGSVDVHFYGSEADRAAEQNEYEVAYYAGTYYVKLEQGNANYISEPVNVIFTIEPKTLTDQMAWIEYEDGDFVYDGKAKTLDEYGVNDEIDGEPDDLEENTDFTVSYSNNINAGTANITFTGKVNYQGTVTKTFNIAAMSLQDLGATVDDIVDQVYTGEAITPQPEVSYMNYVGQDQFETIPLVAGTDFEYSYEYNVDVATPQDENAPKVIVTGKGNYSGTLEKTFTIYNNMAVITASNQTVTYNGQEQEYSNCSVTQGSVVVRYYGTEADRTAGENELEVVVYAGTYYVKVEQGDEKYISDPVNATFTINPKPLTDDMLWSEDDEYVYTGEAIIIEGERHYGIYDEELDDELEENTDFTVSYANNINVGTATVTLTGQGNYEGTLSFTFDIVRQLDISFSETIQWATYYAEENLEIPEGLKAYVVTGIGASDVTAEEITYIPRHVAVLLNYEGQSFERYFLAAAYTGATQEISDNLMWGTSDETDVEDIEGGNVYVLYNNRFVKSISGTIPANRGYLILDDVNSRSLGIVIDDHATGIELTTNTSSRGGREEVYNLQGQHVSKTHKGLVIVNGKKMFVK